MLGLSGSFRACFGLPEQLNLGPENIKSGLNRAVRPPYGLKLSENVATGPRMPLEALSVQKPFTNAENDNFHDFRPRPPWAWALGAAPIGPGVVPLWLRCLSFLWTFLSFLWTFLRFAQSESSPQ